MDVKSGIKSNQSQVWKHRDENGNEFVQIDDRRSSFVIRKLGPRTFIVYFNSVASAPRVH